MMEERVSVALIAHDLRNLLQIAASALRHIDRNLDSRSRNRVQLYERAAAEALARAGILSQALVGRAAGATGVAMVSPGTAITGLMHLIVFTAGPAIQVDVEICDDIPDIACDCGDLENALLNLVVNSRNAMPAGGRLSISLARDGGAVLLRVDDNGAGMGADMAARAFSPFFTTRGGRGGTGLGLAMVKDFAERAGGSAEISSAEGVGTCVTMRFPGLDPLQAIPSPIRE
jgi:signal transduction histidine kinase